MSFDLLTETGGRLLTEAGDSIELETGGGTSTVTVAVTDVLGGPIYAGEAVTLTAVFALNGTPTDPSSVTFTWRSEDDGATITWPVLSRGSLEHVGVGVFATIVTPQLGPLTWTWAATGAVSARASGLVNIATPRQP